MTVVLPDKFKKIEEEAVTLFKQGSVRDIEFSGKTYQVHVFDPAHNQAFWTFLQVESRGSVHDFFCECEEVGDEEPCIHVAAAYLGIFNEHHHPLHVRFQSSFWNAFFMQCADEFGDEPERLVKKKGGYYQISDEEGQSQFSLDTADKALVKQLQTLIEDHPQATEETSLKFSNLTPDEIAKWRAGRPSSEVRYELSLWNDLAKWCLLQQEKGVPAELTFSEQKGALPSSLHMKLGQIKISSKITQGGLSALIPTLKTVSSSLMLYDEGHQTIAAILYHPETSTLELVPKSGKKEKSSKVNQEHTIPIGHWLYIYKDGFYPLEHDEAITTGTLHGDAIENFLDKERQLAQSLIQGTHIHEEPLSPSYYLQFDDNWNLHVTLFIHTPGDMSLPTSHLFGRWAYVENQGFYELKQREFNNIETVITPAEMSNFIQEHRAWLNIQEGFHCRLSSVEAQMSFHVSPEGTLTFSGKTDYTEEGNTSHDFGSWVFIAGQGFFSKTSRSLAIPVRPGVQIFKEQVATFIRTHREELKLIPHFFGEHCPIVFVKLSVHLGADEQVTCRPIYERDLRYASKDILFYDEIVYVHGEGFYELPSDLRLPDRYCSPQTIPEKELINFLTHDLPKIRKEIVDLDPRLRVPEKIAIVAHSFNPAGNQYVAKLSLRTEIGEVPLTDVWYAIKKKRKFLFSSAGLVPLDIKDWEWIKELSKEKIDRRRAAITLSTVDLIKLEATQGVLFDIPGEGAEQARALLRELAHFKTKEDPCITGLFSTLRPYQEGGVKWLWFLYRHGLSGLLCDDMGLGKTHQAMALMAAIRNFKPTAGKFLVVCPTSVLYHWKEKLETFLPSLKVHVFIGTDRDLATFDETGDLLLTSYGIQRNEIEILSKIHFELAIFDEIQVAKNHLSRLHHALLQIKANMILGLTGTPIENYLRELKALFDIVLPHYFPKEHDFKELFVKPIEKDHDAKSVQLLQRMVKPFILRRRKEDVLQDLPEKTEEIAHCDLQPKQQKLYNETLRLSKQKIIDELKDEQTPVPYIHIFALLTHLKQICDHPAVYHKDIDNYKEYESGKWNLFVELMSEARDSRQKVVVFSQYLGMLDIIELYLQEQNVPYATIRGNTLNRGEQLERFNKDPHCEVFVASLQAAGLGVDLTAASVVIHYDRWWNAARENQATDRVHRIGQTRGVQVFKLVSKNTFEERIDALIAKKAALLEDIIGVDDQQVLKTFDRRELLTLLQEVE